MMRLIVLESKFIEYIVSGQKCGEELHIQSNARLLNCRSESVLAEKKPG